MVFWPADRFRFDFNVELLFCLILGQIIAFDWSELCPMKVAGIIPWYPFFLGPNYTFRLGMDRDGFKIWQFWKVPDFTGAKVGVCFENLRRGWLFFSLLAVYFGDRCGTVSYELISAPHSMFITGCRDFALDLLLRFLFVFVLILSFFSSSAVFSSLHSAHLPSYIFLFFPLSHSLKNLSLPPLSPFFSQSTPHFPM